MGIYQCDFVAHLRGTHCLPWRYLYFLLKTAQLFDKVLVNSNTMLLKTLGVSSMKNTIISFSAISPKYTVKT